MSSFRTLETLAKAQYWHLPTISLVNVLSWGGMESNRDLGTSNLTAKVRSSPDARANQASACHAHGPPPLWPLFPKGGPGSASKRFWTNAPWCTWQCAHRLFRVWPCCPHPSTPSPIHTPSHCKQRQLLSGISQSINMATQPLPSRGPHGGKKSIWQHDPSKSVD